MAISHTLTISFSGATSENCQSDKSVLKKRIIAHDTELWHSHEINFDKSWVSAHNWEGLSFLRTMSLEVLLAWPV